MTQAILDLDALLDQNLDAVPDIPDYVTPPAGNYMLRIHDAALDNSAKDKEGNAVVRILVTLAVVSTLETEEMPVADGSLFSERFQFTEDGQAYFKRLAKNVLNVSDLEGVSLRDIFATLKATDPFKAVITHTTSKGKDGKDYTNLRMRPMHDNSQVVIQ